MNTSTNLSIPSSYCSRTPPLCPQPERGWEADLEMLDAQIDSGTRAIVAEIDRWNS